MSTHTLLWPICKYSLNANTTAFFIRDLSIRGFWYGRGAWSWNQSPRHTRTWGGLPTVFSHSTMNFPSINTHRELKLCSFVDHLLMSLSSMRDHQLQEKRAQHTEESTSKLLWNGGKKAFSPGSWHVPSTLNDSLPLHYMLLCEQVLPWRSLASNEGKNHMKK